MNRTYKDIKEYRHLNNLPKKLVVEVDGYGMYNTKISYSIMCLYKGNYINTNSQIEFRKLINNDTGVYENLRKMFTLSLSEMTFRIPKEAMKDKNMVILMGVGDKYTVCCCHKFKDTKHLFDDFEYIFKSIVLHHKSNLTNPHK